MSCTVRYFLGLFVVCGVLVGCADSGQSKSSRTTADQRQDKALKDPFGYGGDTEKVDITGGGIGEYDKKAMKRDLDSVFSP